MTGRTVSLAEHAELRAEMDRLTAESERLRDAMSAMTLSRLAAREALDFERRARGLEQLDMARSEAKVERLYEALIEVRERWAYPRLVAVVDAALDGTETW